MKRLISIKKIGLVLILSAVLFIIGASLSPSFCMNNNSQEVQVQEQEVKAAKSVGESISHVAAALAIGLGSIAAGLAVAASVPAALGAFSEDQSTFGKAIVFVALGEGVSILSFIIAIIILFA